ncbi:MAG: hypothetical protein ABI896_08355 [Actinomycetota bacterium]
MSFLFGVARNAWEWSFVGSLEGAFSTVESLLQPAAATAPTKAAPSRIWLGLIIVCLSSMKPQGNGGASAT